MNIAEPYCATVLGKYADMGFTLAELDDHLLELGFKGAMIARFLQEYASIRVIRNACLQYLASLNHGYRMVGT